MSALGIGRGLLIADYEDAFGEKLVERICGCVFRRWAFFRVAPSGFSSGRSSSLPSFLPGFALRFRSRRLRLFDDQRAGGSAKHLGFAAAVNVGMVPIQARRLSGRDAELIFEGGVRGSDQSVQRFVLMASGRNAEAVKVQVGGIRGHVRGAAGAAWIRSWCRVGGCQWRGDGQVIFQFQSDQIAGMNAQTGRLAAIGIDVAVTGLSGGIEGSAKGQRGGESSVDATKLWGRCQQAADCGARAGFRIRVLGKEKRRTRQEGGGNRDSSAGSLQLHPLNLPFLSGAKIRCPAKLGHCDHNQRQEHVKGDRQECPPYTVKAVANKSDTFCEPAGMLPDLAANPARFGAGLARR